MVSFKEGWGRFNDAEKFMWALGAAMAVWSCFWVIFIMAKAGGDIRGDALGNVALHVGMSAVGLNLLTLASMSAGVWRASRCHGPPHHFCRHTLAEIKELAIKGD